MTPERLAERHPTLYHMADARNWPLIERFGLLGTSAILDRLEVSGPSREAIESSHRPTLMPVDHPTLGRAFIRDQRPLDLEALAPFLDGLTPRQWLETLNRRVFFWPTSDRLEKMIKGYLGDEQAVLEVDTLRLARAYAGQIELSRINSGFASKAYRPARRGVDTFVPLADFPDRAKDKVAEVTVPGGVPDIFEYATRVVGRLRKRDDRAIWPAPD